MSSASFSSLIYRIIGKPERWHDDYIVKMMQQVLDEAGVADNPVNMSELAAGEQLLSRLQQGNIALNAFNTLLDRSRFQMIILDSDLQPLYYNKIASDLYAKLCNGEQNNRIDQKYQSQIEELAKSLTEQQSSALHALEISDLSNDQVYLRSVLGHVEDYGQPTRFFILMALSNRQSNISLNSDLVARYRLTDKEQSVIVHLVHGNNTKEIAKEMHISEHTVKTHLKSIYNKTETRSQGSLISLVLTHESQIMDSYFESDISTGLAPDNNPNDKEVTLSCGLTVAYCEYGPSDGRPLIVFHSGFGSRLAIPNNYEEICERTNRRIIVPDRPGIGKTPFVPNHPDRWNEQLSEFINILELESYDVLGSVIACQLALSFANSADERLQTLILTSPVILNHDEDAQYLTEILQPAARYVKQSKEFAKEVYLIWLKSVTLNLDAHYPTMLDASIGSAERELFEREDTIRLLTKVFKEGARQTLDGILNEMAFCMSPLQMDFSNFNVPVVAWYGTEDKRITQEGVEKALKALPNCELHIKDGYSEHLYYALLEEIIA